MKVKYILLYSAVGVAFLAVSLWLILSGGKSARAVRTKYRLGGAMLTLWALFSASTCGPRIHVGEPLCYDMPAPTNEVSIAPKTGESFKSGEIMTVNIDIPTFDKYAFEVRTASNVVLLQGEKVLPEEKEYKYEFEIKLPGTKYKGNATLNVEGLAMDSEGKEYRETVCSKAFTIE